MRRRLVLVALLLLAAVAPASAAVSIDGGAACASGNTTNGSNISITVTGNANRLVVFFASQNSTGLTAPTATFNAVAMTRVNEFSTTGRTTSWFIIKEADLPAAGTYNLVSSGWDFGFGYIAFCLSGVDQTTPNDTATNVTNTATATGSVTETTQTGDLVLDYIVVHANSETISALDGQSNVTTGVTTGLAFTNRLATNTGSSTAGTSWSWTTNIDYRHVTVNINGAPVTAGTPRLLLLGVGGAK